MSKCISKKRFYIGYTLYEVKESSYSNFKKDYQATRSFFDGQPLIVYNKIENALTVLKQKYKVKKCNLQ